MRQPLTAREWAVGLLGLFVLLPFVAWSIVALLFRLLFGI